MHIVHGPMTALAIILALMFVSASACADTKLECELMGAGFEASPSNGTTKLVYIASKTETHMLEDVTFEYLQEKMKGVRAETFRSFKANNETSVTVDCAGVKPAGRDVVVDDGKIPDHESRYSISRAGIAADGSQALLFSGYSCGPLCGGGSIFMFERVNGKWARVGMAMVWIS